MIVKPSPLAWYSFRIWPLLIMIATATSCSNDGSPTNRPQAADQPTRSVPRQGPSSSPRPKAPAKRRLARRHAVAMSDKAKKTATNTQKEIEEPEARSDTVSGPPQLDIAAQRLSQSGIRRLQSKHLELYTDLASTPEVDLLPHLFDLAVPQWRDYFRIPSERVRLWKMRGYLMSDKERFRKIGLLPDNLPPFLNGYQRGHEIWMYEQPSAYYRRHIVLHEGTHAFMDCLLGGKGPPWYSEGMAELMATHSWKAKHLQLGYFPRNRDEVESWGRIKIIREDVAAGDAKSIHQVMLYGPRAHLQVGPYGWCWAACALMDGTPRFHDAFRQLPQHVQENPSTFIQTTLRLFGPNIGQLNQQWQLFTHRIEYGYDVQREAIVNVENRSLPAEGREVVVSTERGWQSTGIQVAAGATYLLEASGRYQIAETSKVWWCEPPGVTIRYYAGQPLGIVLAAADDASDSPTYMTQLLSAKPVGDKRELTFARSGTLYLRINDSPAELADNRGEARVRIRQIRPSADRVPN